jgi:hypothetical protein
VISDNGRYVAFVSSASNLVGSDTNGVPDVFVRDRSSASTQRVSTTSTGGQLNGLSGGSTTCSQDPEGQDQGCSYGRSVDTRSLAISDDGRFVAFLSSASNVVGATVFPQVYVKDRSTGALKLASRGPNGAPANNHSFALELSGNGSRLAFWSDATNFDDPGSTYSDLFVVPTTGGAGAQLYGWGGPCFASFLSECDDLSYPHDHAPSLTDDGQQVVFTADWFDGFRLEFDDLYPLISGDGRYHSYQRSSWDTPGGHTTVIRDHGRYRIDSFTDRTTEVVPGNVEPAAKEVNSGGNLAVAVTDRVRVRTVPKALQIRYRVNAGGPAYTGPTGAWQADTGSSGGSVYVTDSDVFDPAGDARLYRSERWGMSGYSLPVANGRYRVRLHFAEISPCCPDAGDRVFDVRIEGALVLDDFDINVAAGTNEGNEPLSPYYAIRREFITTVQDGRLDITFPRVVGTAKISGIEVMDSF